MLKISRTAASLAAAALSVGLTALAPGGAIAAPGETTPAPVPARYANQRLAWALCLPGAEDPTLKRLECATMTVPRDWNMPSAGIDLSIALSRLRPLRGEPIGTLAGNPGGPGAPGLGMPLLLAERPAVAAKMELVGFDPRGTGASSNVTCAGGPAAGVVNARDRRRVVRDLVARAAKLYGDFCHLRSGPLIDYINTEQTVKDVDLIRKLLGRDRISFVGYSGGTWMGAHYATYFPDHTGNFLLDSNTQFTSPWSETFGLQPLGFERRFRQDFGGWAARHDAVLHLGRSADAVRNFYETLRADYAARPLELITVVGRSTIDQNIIDLLLVICLYNKGTFGDLAMVFAGLRDAWDGPAGSGSAAAQARFDALSADQKEALGRSLQRAQLYRPVSEDAFPATFTAITCNDTAWERGQDHWDRFSASQGRRYPILGWSMNQSPCGYWQRPELRMLTPTGTKVPTTLMIQSEHDPATPYEGALAAHQAFAGSRLVTVHNEGDHGVYTGGNPCVDAIGDAFLLTGRAPAKDTICEGVPIPAPQAARAAKRTGTLSVFERAVGYNELIAG